MNIRQLTKTHWYIGESLVSFRQFGECTLNSRQHILWTFAICECPVGESLIGEIRVSQIGTCVIDCMQHYLEGARARFSTNESSLVVLPDQTKDNRDIPVPTELLRATEAANSLSKES